MDRWSPPFIALGKVNPRFYGLGMARRMAWLSALAAIAVALAVGALVTGWTLWSFLPVVALPAVRATVHGAERAPGVIALAMVAEATSIVSGGTAYLYALFVAPVLLVCFMTAAAIDRDRATRGRAAAPRHWGP